MKFKNLALAFNGALLAVCLFTASGCGRSASNSGNGATAFASAKSRLSKAEWDVKIAAADAANDYATVILSSRKLLPQSALTPEQKSALAATMTAANTRMMDAVQKGDPAAIKANQDVNQRTGDDSRSHLLLALSRGYQRE